MIGSVVGRDALVVRWRTLEWWGAGIALFLQTGAVFPMLLRDASGELDAAARSQLQLLQPPVYLITALLLARHTKPLLIAIRRNLLLCLLLALPFVTVLWSVYPSVTLRRSIALLCSVALSFLLALRFTPRQFLLLVGAVLGTCIVLSLALTVVSPHLAWMNTEMRGVFMNKNALGWYSALSTLVFCMISADRSLGMRRIAVPMSGASIVCLLASQSITAALVATSALGFAWFLVALTKFRGWARALLVLVFLQSIALILVSLGEFVVPFLESIGKDATLTGRVPLWAMVDDEIARRPLLGYGYQAFWTNASGGAWRIWVASGWFPPHAHNGYRDALLSLGIGGFVLLVAAIGRAAAFGLVMLCRVPEDGWLWLNVLVWMFLLMNLTESIMLVQNDFIFTTFAAALVMFSLRVAELRQSRGRL